MAKGKIERIYNPNRKALGIFTLLTSRATTYDVIPSSDSTLMGELCKATTTCQVNSNLRVDFLLK